MTTPRASAEIIPVHTDAKDGATRDQSTLRRLPTLDEVPAPRPNFARGEVVIYRGIGSTVADAYQKPTQTRAPAASSLNAIGGSGPIQGFEFFQDEERPGRLDARVMILEEGSLQPREALITPTFGVGGASAELATSQALPELVSRANMEISRFFDGFGPIDSDVKVKEFERYAEKQSAMRFLFDNLLKKNEDRVFDLFSAYFAPGGAISGVGVFVNTWL